MLDMSRKRQIWYRKGTAGAALANSIKDSYDLRAIAAVEFQDSRGTKPTEEGRVFLLDVESESREFARRVRISDPHSRVVGVIGRSHPSPPQSASSQIPSAGLDSESVFAYLSAGATLPEIRKTLAIAFENIELVEGSRSSNDALGVAEREQQQLNEIGVALSSERDINALLTLILKKAREITGADAGSLYLVDEGADRQRGLEFTLPLAEDSMAGYVALGGEVLNFPDAHHIPEGLPFHFNDRYDRDSGYRTKSLLTLPMRNAKGEVLGVLQLINSKRDAAAKLLNESDVVREVQSFPERSVQLALSLASQAAVAYE